MSAPNTQDGSADPSDNNTPHTLFARLTRSMLRALGVSDVSDPPPDVDPNSRSPLRSLVCLQASTFMAYWDNPEFTSDQLSDIVKSTTISHATLWTNQNLPSQARLALRGDMERIAGAISGMNTEIRRDAASGHFKASLYHLTGDKSLLDDQTKRALKINEVTMRSGRIATSIGIYATAHGLGSLFWAPWADETLAYFTNTQSLLSRTYGTFRYALSQALNSAPRRPGEADQTAHPADVDGRMQFSLELQPDDDDTHESLFGDLYGGIKEE